MQRSIFITGASTGLGKAAALLFQSKGWHVIATMRNPGKETELTRLPNVTVLQLDVTDQDQIRDVVNKTTARQRIDVLLNNAGYGLIGVLEALSDDQIKRQIDTNLLGVIRTTRAFIPHLREQKQGTIINISSMFGLTGYPTCSVYAATKFAIEGFSESLAYEMAGFGVKVKTIAPGGIQTDFAGRSMDSGHHPAYDTLAAKVSEGYSEEKISQYTDPAAIAAIIYQAATDNKDQLRYIAGKDAIDLYSQREQLGAEAQYRSIREMFRH